MKDKSKRLWDKGTEPDELIHRFTVGDDPECISPIIQKANFTDANLYEAILYEADLRAVNFTGADLCGANLANADLQKAILTRADHLPESRSPSRYLLVESDEYRWRSYAPPLPACPLRD